MKKEIIWKYMQLLAAPVTVCLFGLLLLFSPDTASALVGLGLGVALLLAGVGFLVAAVALRERRVFYALVGLCMLALGVMLLREPLMLASGLGRIVGVLLLIQSVRDFFLSSYGHGKLLSGITAAAGLVLTLLPMTTSRLVFMALGVLLLIVGVTELVEKLRYDRIDNGKSGDVIDAQ